MNKLIRAITFKNVYAICLGPFGIYIDDDTFSSTTINHEMIHWQQQKEMLIVFFYLWYIIEWIIRKIFSKKDAYYCLSFEVEANVFEQYPDYISKRKHFRWISYILKHYE